MERTQFTFYESFYKAISRIRKAADRCAAYDVICSYALYGTAPEIEKLPDAAAIAFELSKPNLDASRRKANSGKQGGTAKQTGSKREANRKQTGSKPKANGKQTESKGEKEKEKEKEKENECYPPISPQRDIFADYAGEDAALLTALGDFEAMRKKIKRPMTDRAKELLLSKLDTLGKKHDRTALLNEAVLHCWQSVYPPETKGDAHELQEL